MSLLVLLKDAHVAELTDGEEMFGNDPNYVGRELEGMS